jgi:glyoxylase-like metal-dependent hydrolase (beta-lactamase superfamily II)
MKIDRLILGAYETNCYVLRKTEAARDCLIIDTGLESGKLLDFLGDNKLKPTALVLTHGHIDHIAGLPTLRSNWPEIKVYIHKLDAEILTDPKCNLSIMTGRNFTAGPVDFTIDEPDIIEQADIKLTVLHTPGHTPGGISLYSAEQGIVFVGDTLFADSVGRTDFPGSDTSRLINSIKEKLLTLPDRTIVWPGHGPRTTIEREKTHNPYLQP